MSTHGIAFILTLFIAAVFSFGTLTWGMEFIGWVGATLCLGVFLALLYSFAYFFVAWIRGDE